MFINTQRCHCRIKYAYPNSLIIMQANVLEYDICLVSYIPIETVCWIFKTPSTDTGQMCLRKCNGTWYMLSCIFPIKSYYMTLDFMQCPATEAMTAFLDMDQLITIKSDMWPNRLHVMVLMSVTRCLSLQNYSAFVDKLRGLESIIFHANHMVRLRHTHYFHLKGSMISHRSWCISIHFWV